MTGALFFGWLTDRLGRKKLFFITLAVYLLATAATGLSLNGAMFFLFRFLTGAGIGGEYTAINSAIQELVPARYRGATDLAINGSFWVGAAIGALAAIVLLNPNVIDPELGWRLAFLIGAAIGLVIILMRMWIPESPRWLIIHGRPEEAERIVKGIEERVEAGGGSVEPLGKGAFRIRGRTHTPLGEVFDTLLRKQLKRTLVGLTLMASQAFLYNAIFFTYALILTDFYQVPGQSIGWAYPAFRDHQLPWPASARAAVRFLGPPTHDLADLRRIWRAAPIGRRPVCGRPAHRDDDHPRLDGGVLLRLARRQFGLSDGKRNLPGRNPRVGDRDLLCSRHGDRRGDRAGPVRRADPERLADQRLCGLCVRGRADAGRLAVVAALFAVQAERRPLEEVATPLSCVE